MKTAYLLILLTVVALSQVVNPYPRPLQLATTGGGGGTVSIQQDGSAIGSRGTLNFITGTCDSAVLSDTGTKINIQQGVDTATCPSTAIVQSGSTLLITTTSASGTTYTGTMAPTLTAYTSGQVLNWAVGSTACTAGAVTINVDTLGAKSIKNSDGTTNPTATDCSANKIVPLTYDGTVFRLPNSGGATASLCYSGPLASTSIPNGSVDTQVFPSCPLPAATIPSGGCLVGDSDFDLTGLGAGLTPKIWLGSSALAGSSLTVSDGVIPGSAGVTYWLHFKVCNNNASTTVQTLEAWPIFHQSAGAFADRGTGNQTTTNALVLSLSLSNASGGSVSLIPTSFKVNVDK